MTSDALPRLRPLSTGQLLDQGIRLYRRNFLKFVGIIAVVQIPLTLVALLVSLITFPGEMMAALQDPTMPAAANPLELFGPTQVAGGVGSCFLGIISLILIQGVATAALTRSVADHYLGRRTGFLEAYRRIGRSWLKLMGAYLFAIVVSIGLLVWLVLGICVGWLTGIGMILFFGQVIMPLVTPIIILENQTVPESMRRAWDLARRRFWWVVAFTTLLYLFNQLIVGGPGFLINIVFQALQQHLLESLGPSAAYTTQTVVQSVTTLIASLIYLPLQLIGMTLMYFDLRIRTEGFDLTLLADSALGGEADTDEITMQAPPAQTTGILTWSEMGYFALLSIAALTLYAAISAILAGIGLAIMSIIGRPPGF